MHIVSLELEFSKIFYFLPSFSLILGKSIHIGIHWLNFYLALKHISLDYKAKCWNFYFPSITLNQYPKSAYNYTLEIDAFGYIYRRGLFRNKDKEIRPYDNTPGLVHLSWLKQFKSTDTDLMKNIDDFIKGIKDLIEKSEKP